MPFTKYIVFINLSATFFYLPSMGMDEFTKSPDDAPKSNDSSIHINMSALPTNPIPYPLSVDHPATDDVNLDEDIPGCTDNFFRGILKGLRIFQGPVDLAAVVTTSAAGLLNLAVYAVSFTGDFLGNVTSSNATGTSFVREQNQKLIAAAALLNGVSASLQLLRAYWQKAIHDDQELLRKLILEERAKNK